MDFAQLQKNRPAIYAIAAKYGIENIRVFGSVARGDADEASDVDLMVNMKRPNLFALGGFRADMEDLFGKSIDVVEEEALHPFLRNAVMRDIKPL